MRHLTPLLSALLLTGGAIMAQTPNTPPLALPPPQVTGVAEPIIAQPPKTPPPGSEQAPVSADARIPEDVWLKMLRYMEQFAKEPRLQKPEPEIVPDPANSKPLKKIEPRADELPARGLGHQRVEWVGEVLDEQGKRSLVTNSYIQLETGLNHHDANGELVPSDPNFELTADGAIAWKGQHRVSLSGSPDGSGAVQIRMPDNRLLVGNVVGLAYYDAASSQSVMIAEVQKAEGWLTNPNQVTYVDAFTGVKADLRYTSSKAGLEQDVILRETPPDPAKLGFDPATTRLEVWTEFTDAPEPKLKKRQKSAPETGNPKSSKSEDDDEDSVVDFGAMQIGEGRAFSTGQEAGPENILVKKRWLRTPEGRVFLIEAVHLPGIRPQLDKLPTGRAGLSSPFKTGLPRMQALIGLPRKAKGQKTHATIRRPSADQASVLNAKAGFVMDWNILNPGWIADQTFRGDTTYHITDRVYLSGTTTIEGGTVIQYSKIIWGSVYPGLLAVGPVVCKTSPFRPAIFTACDDDTVGEKISGSTGTPGWDRYGEFALRIYNASGIKLENMRFYNGHCTLSIDGSASNSVVNMQFFKCAWPIVNTYAADLGCYNVLIQDVHPGGYSFDRWGTTNSIFGEHVTVRNSCLKGACNLTLKNSLVTDLGCTSGYVNGGGTVVLSSEAGVFQSVWGGNNYLADGSPYRNVGVTNIAAELAVGFREMTTYAPQILTGSLAAGTVLAPVVARDVDMPDLGYHYPALDYLLSGAIVQGGTVTLTNGVGIGFSGSCAFDLRDAGVLVSEGRPDRLNRILRQQLVQERSVVGEATADAVFKANTAVTTKPSLGLRFTEVNTLAWADASSTLDPTRGRLELLKTTSLGSPALALQSLALTDCQFGGVTLNYSPNSTSATTVGLVNNVFERGRVSIGISGSANSLTLSLRNNLFWRTSVSVNHYQGGALPPPWIVMENVFDNANPFLAGNSGDPFGNVLWDYNGYVNAGEGGGTHNQNVATFTYATGPLGKWYQSSTTFVNAGSRTAGAAGLYQSTTRAIQTKEGSSVVDLGFHYPATTVITPTVTGQQGANGWYYRYCSVIGGPPDNNIPSWNGSNWFDASKPTSDGDYFTLIGQAGYMIPGQTRDTALVYQLPSSGRVFVHADVTAVDTSSCSDGVRVRAMYDGAPATSWVSVPPPGPAVAYDTSVAAVAGHQLAFVVNRNSANWCDWTVALLSLSFDRPADSDGDGIPDYLEDRNGNGVVDAGETSATFYDSANGLTTSGSFDVYTLLK